MIRKFMETYTSAIDNFADHCPGLAGLFILFVCILTIPIHVPMAAVGYLLNDKR